MNIILKVWFYNLGKLKTFFFYSNKFFNLNLINIKKVLAKIQAFSIILK
jgi:hypothetical protein